MASTIQIKRGTGSAIPTGLADGELAINLDNGKLYFGSGSTSVNDFTFGEITAEKYIVSSSVLYVTTSFSSGSTEFGDTADDTHTFTGNITASGNIQIGNDAEITSTGNMTFRIDSDANESSQKFTWKDNADDEIASLSGEGDFIIYGSTLGDPKIRLQQETNASNIGPPIFEFFRNASNTDNNPLGILSFIGRDSSGNEHTYGRITGTQEETGTGTEGGKLAFQIASHDGEIVDGLIIEDGDAEDEVDVTIGNTTTSLTTIAGNLSITSNVTASGNISSSGEIEANTFKASGNVDFNGDLDVDGTTNLDVVDIDGNVQLDGTLTVGVSGTGHDVTLFGETHGKFIKWDQSADLLDIRSETNFGVAGTGVDVTFFGDTSGKFMKWDQSQDQLKLYDNTNLVFGTGVSNEADFDASIFWDTADLVIDSETDIKIVADGGSVIVTGEITSSGNISSSGTVTADRFMGSQLTMVPWNYYVSSDHSDELYIPQGGSQVEVNSDQPYNFMLAPYDGKVRRLSVYYQTGDPGTLTARVRAAAAPFDLDDADDIVETVVVSSGVEDTMYFFDFSAAFSKGDAVALTIQADAHSSNTYVAGTLSVEYNTTT